MPLTVTENDKVVMYTENPLKPRAGGEPPTPEEAAQIPVWFFVNGTWDGEHYTVSDLGDGTLYTEFHYPYTATTAEEVFVDGVHRIPNDSDFNTIPFVTE